MLNQYISSLESQETKHKTLFQNLKKNIFSSIFVFLFSIFSFSSVYATDGSGIASVNPTAAFIGSTNNNLNFEYTATEAMGDGSVLLSIANDWPNPTIANTTVTVMNGMLADLIASLDSNVINPFGVPGIGWNSDIQGVCVGCTVTLNTDAVIHFEGTGSLKSQGNLTIGIGPIARIYFNFLVPQNWSNYSKLSFYIKNDDLLSASLFNSSQLLIAPAANLAGAVSYPLSGAIFDITAIASGQWTQVIVNLTSQSPITRNSVLSYGLILPSLPAAALNGVIHLDHIIVGPGSPIFNSNIATANLLTLNKGGVLNFNYHGVTAPNAIGSYLFPISQSVNSGGIITSLLNGSPSIEVVSIAGSNAQPNHVADIDGDKNNELAIDIVGAGCFDFFFDPDASSVSCFFIDANHDGCKDFFIDTRGYSCQVCPNVFWDGTKEIRSVITPERVDLIGDGVLDDVCVFDSNGDSINDSYLLINKFGGATVGTLPVSTVEGGCNLNTPVRVNRSSSLFYIFYGISLFLFLFINFFLKVKPRLKKTSLLK